MKFIVIIVLVSVVVIKQLGCLITVNVIFIILRNSSSSANGQTAFWLPSSKLAMPTTKLIDV